MSITHVGNLAGPLEPSQHGPTVRTVTTYGYARVSTRDQDPQLQLDALTAAGVDERDLYLERAGGALARRAQLDELLHKLQTGDTLTVWRLDRLGRNLPHLIVTINDLADRGINFTSLTEAIDTTTATGRLMLGVLATLAAFERDLIRERTTAGLAAARAQGRRGGRPTVMTAEKLAIARQMLNAGTPKTVIARTIGVSRPTLYTHLQPHS